MFNSETIKNVFDLTGKTALVTGAAAGLGEAIAWGMACFGANVVAADLYQDILSRIPQNRFAEVEEIIGPAVFLASRASDFVTGISLIMDGGWTAQ